jgi:hypothetical protein
MKLVVQVEAYGGAVLSREAVVEALHTVADRFQYTHADAEEHVEAGTSDMVNDDYHEVVIKWRVDPSNKPNLVLLRPGKCDE